MWNILIYLKMSFIPVTTKLNSVMIWRTHNVPSPTGPQCIATPLLSVLSFSYRDSTTQMYARGQWESSSHKSLWHRGVQWGFCGMCREEDVQAKHYGLYRINSSIPSKHISYTDLTPTQTKKLSGLDRVWRLFLYFLRWFWGEILQNKFKGIVYPKIYIPKLF